MGKGRDKGLIMKRGLFGSKEREREGKVRTVKGKEGYVKVEKQREGKER